MLKGVLLFILASFPFVSGLECCDIIFEDHCSDLSGSHGCVWDDSEGRCKGTFSHDCENTCIYVDPLSQAETQDGSYKYPFLDLDDALSAAIGLKVPHVELILINTDYDRVFHIKKQYNVVRLPETITIR